MPRNGSGLYTLPQAAFAPSTTILATAVNSNFSDIATALSGSISADGQTPLTGPFKFPSGSSGSPSVTFSNDGTTGLYLSAAGILGIAIAGAAGVTVQAPSASTGSGLLGAAGAVVQPIGIIQDFAGSSAPAGWFLCYGQTLASASYPELYAVIGTTYGGTSANFALPDLRGVTIAGKTNMGGSASTNLTSTYFGADPTVLGTAGGSQSHTLSTAEMPAHTHANSLTDPGHTHTLALQNTLSGTPSGGATVGGSGLSTGSSTTGVTITNASQGGGGAHAIVQPTIVLNKIIFAGRA